LYRLSIKTGFSVISSPYYELNDWLSKELKIKNKKELAVYTILSYCLWSMVVAGAIQDHNSKDVSF
jgi:hypothetical protein